MILLGFLIKVCLLGAFTLLIATGVVSLLFCEIERVESERTSKALVWMERRNFLLKLSGVLGLLFIFFFFLAALFYAGVKPA